MTAEDLKKLKSTTLLFNKEHVLLYLGTDHYKNEQQFYAIHDTNAQGLPHDPNRKIINSVVVTTLSSYGNKENTRFEPFISANVLVIFESNI